MILPTTLRKLAAQHALVYKATKEAFMFNGVTIPAHSQYFVSLKAAEKWLDDGFAYGAVASETADMTKHYLLT